MSFQPNIPRTAVASLFMAAICLFQTPLVLAELEGPTQQADTSVDPAIELYKNHNGLSGRLSIAGSDTMGPLVSKLAAQFMTLHPAVQIAVEGVGSNAAIREFQLGLSYQRRGDKVRGKGTGGSNRVELLASSRDLTEDELNGFASHQGYQPTGIPIAMDAVAIYVHKDNPLQQLTLEQVDAIFGKERKRGQLPITHWGQLGITGAFFAQPCHLYGRDQRSGTRAFFRHLALGDGELRDEVIEQPGSASEIIAIAQDPLAIGYAGVGFQVSSVKTVPIAHRLGESALWPSRENVLSGSYPLSRPLFLYVKKDPTSSLVPLVKEFLLFINSRQGQETVVRANVYPLSAAQVTENLRSLGLQQGAMTDTSERAPMDLTGGIPDTTR